MLVVIELASLCAIGLAIRALLGRKLAENLLGMAVLLATYATSAIAFVTADQLFERLADNLFLRFGLDAVVAVVASLYCVRTLRRRLERDDRELTRRFTAMLRLEARPILDKLLSGALLATLGLLLTVAVFLLLNMGVQLSPPARMYIEQHSLALRWMLAPEVTPEVASRTAGHSGGARAPQDAPRSVLGTVAHGLESAKASVLDEIGTKELAVQLSALGELTRFSRGEYEQLIEGNALLRRLVEHPTLRALGEDEEILTLARRAAEGDFAAFYHLGGQPTIKRMLADDELASSLRALDIVELKNQAVAHRERRAQESAQQLAEMVRRLEVRVRESVSCVDLLSPATVHAGESFEVHCHLMHSLLAKITVEIGVVTADGTAAPVSQTQRFDLDPMSAYQVTVALVADESASYRFLATVWPTGGRADVARWTIESPPFEVEVLNEDS